MLVRREKIIPTFKILSIILLAYMMIDFYSAIKNENPIDNFKISEQESSLKIKKNQNSFFGISERMSICEQTAEENIDSNFFINTTVYYSFAVFLGAFINAKKIMKIGVI